MKKLNHTEAKKKEGDKPLFCSDPIGHNCKTDKVQDKSNTSAIEPDKGGGWGDIEIILNMDWDNETKFEWIKANIVQLLASQKSQIVEELEGMEEAPFVCPEYPIGNGACNQKRCKACSSWMRNSLEGQDGYNKALENAIQKISGGDK